jgi:hypothetical protein
MRLKANVASSVPKRSGGEISDVRRQMCEIDVFLVAKQDCPLNHVTEFSDVSGPGVSFQRV